MTVNYIHEAENIKQNLQKKLGRSIQSKEQCANDIHNNQGIEK